MLSILFSIFVNFSVGAQIAIEPHSVALRELKTLQTHTMAVYEGKDGNRSRNPMLPRLLRKAIENDPQNTEISVVVADEKAIEWFKTATSILEYLPQDLREASPEVSWFTRSQEIGGKDLIEDYWLVPFGNPIRSLENTKARDVQWSLETIENILKRYILLKDKGYHVSIVLDLLDGADTAELAFWVLNNINMGLLKSNASLIPIKTLFNNGVSTELKDHKTKLLFETPENLKITYPELSKKFENLIKTYVEKLVIDSACAKALK